MKNVRSEAKINHFVLEADDLVLPCPFCGEVDYETDQFEGGISLHNTHTASYWIECPCGAEVHGKSYGGGSVRDHRRAAASALNKWNERTVL